MSSQFKSDAQAVRDAVTAAPDGGTVKVAGICAGVDANGRVVGIAKNLTVTGGYTETEAMYDNDTNPVLGYGGGLYVAGGTLDNTRVISNEASYAGGGIYNNGGTLTLNNDSRVDYNDSGAWVAASISKGHIGYLRL